MPFTNTNKLISCAREQRRHKRKVTSDDRVIIATGIGDSDTRDSSIGSK